jgi:hypothetical protein
LIRDQRFARWANAIYRFAIVAAFLLPLPILSQADLLWLWPIVGFFAIACGTMVHEFGHAIGCLAARGRVAMLALYPLVIELSPLHLRWQRRRRVWFATGRTEYAFARRHGKRYMLVTLGGPCADASMALVSLAVFDLTSSSPVVRAFSLHSSFSAHCTSYRICCLVPAATDVRC